MTPTELAQFLTSEYGLTRREAVFTAKLVEGKSIIAASQETSMTTNEGRTVLNRVLFKIPSLIPPQASHKYQDSNAPTQVLGSLSLSKIDGAQAFPRT